MRYFRYVPILLLLITATASAQNQPLSLDAIVDRVETGEYAAALDALDTRIAADINDVQARFLKGLVLMEQGDRAGAEAVFLEITRLFPALPEAYNNLAALYVEQGDYERAQQTLQEALANTREDALLRNNLGDLYVTMAVDAYRQARSLEPGDPELDAKLDYLEPMLAP